MILYNDALTLRYKSTGLVGRRNERRLVVASYHDSQIPNCCHLARQNIYAVNSIYL